MQQSLNDVDNGESYNVARIQANASSMPDLGIMKEVRLDDPKIQVIVEMMDESEAKPTWEKISSYSPAVKVYWGQWKSLDVIPSEVQHEQLIISTHIR